MRTKITDEDALRALSWVDLKAYLDSQGWRAAGTYAGKAAIYASPSDNGGTAEILVPLNDDVADYAARMADAVAALARIEDRDEQAIFSDLSEAGSDVIRLRASEADDEGTISLADGVALHREAENLMLAAACAAVEPRRSYHARKIAEVRDYLDELRLGQTERGSYVMTIRSPISPALRSSRLELFDAMAALLDDDGGEPFSLTYSGSPPASPQAAIRRVLRLDLGDTEPGDYAATITVTDGLGRRSLPIETSLVVR